MKKYTLYILTIAALAFASACNKAPQPTPVPDPEPGPIYEDMNASEIWYTTTDGKAMTPVNIGDFDVNYVSTVFDEETGTGVMYFDGPVKKIGDNAFAGSELLATVVIPEEVQTIGKNAFKGCKNLTSVEFNGSVNEICDYAFSECGFEEFKFPGKITKMGTGVMKDCKKLTAVEFAKTDALIGDYCFDGCENLNDVTFPQQAKTLGSYVFKGCNKYRIVEPSFDEIPSLGENTFAQDSLFFITASLKRMDEYKSKWSAYADHVMLSWYDVNQIDLANWTDYMPDCMPLSMMTVPAAHDAATYFANSHTPWAAIIKDQDLDYSQSWNWGTRMFDLRVGYYNMQLSYVGFFCHGKIFELSQLNNIEDDIKDHFPTKDQIKNSFMILELQIDMPGDPTDEGGAYLQDYVTSELVAKYGREKFVLYRPDMTLGEARGKIMFFVTDKELTQDITSLSGTSPLPTIYRNTGDSTMTPFYGDKDAKPFPFAYQNKFEVEHHPNEKLEAILNGLEQRKANKIHLPFFNGLNAAFALETGLGMSWPVSTYINPIIVDYLSANELDDKFCQPLGFVFYDYVGIQSLSQVVSSDPVFKGDELAHLLVWHNFKDVYFKY